MDSLAGVWKLVESENFDAYMKEVGVGFISRQMGNTLKPNVKFELDGDVWSMSSISSVRTHTIKFKLNEEFDEETADGRKVKATFSVVDNQLVHTEKDKDGKTSVITRTVTPEGKLRVALKAGNVEALRVYERE